MKRAKGGQLMHGHARRGHIDPMHRIWREILQRCMNETNPRYKDYGKRGIKVHPRWLRYSNFIEDVHREIGMRPSGLGVGGRALFSLDRKDNEKGYEPGNLRWATAREQSLNSRRAHFLTLEGTTLALCEWAQRLNVSHTAIIGRLRRGMSETEALATPFRRRSL